MNNAALQEYEILIRISYSYIYTDNAHSPLSHVRAGNNRNEPNKTSFTYPKNNSNSALSHIHMRNYSCVGQVLAIGNDIYHVRIGDFVACAPFGIMQHADLITLSWYQVAPISDINLLQELSLAGYGTAALRCIRRAHLTIGETVCVVGLNVIGQLIVRLAVQTGCNVIAADQDEKLLQKAHEYGAHTISLQNGQSFINTISSYTAKKGADVVIAVEAYDTTLLTNVVHATRYKGRIIIMNEAAAFFDRYDGRLLSMREIEIKGAGFMQACASSYQHCRPMRESLYEKDEDLSLLRLYIEMIQKSSLSVNDLLNNIISIEDLESLTTNQGNSPYGIVMCYQSSRNTTSKNYKNHINHMPHQKVNIKQNNELTLGIVGTVDEGESIKEILVALSAVSNLDIRVIASMTEHQFGNQSHRLVPQEMDIITDNSINMVFICTPLCIRAAHIIEALQNNKAVLVDPPIATFNNIHTILSYLSDNQSARLCVNSYRTHAPFIQKIKATLQNRKTPLMVQYRLNSRALLSNQNTPFLSCITTEIYHIIDIFCYLVDSAPAMISVESVRSMYSAVLPTENFCATISFHDGSICSLFYVSLGGLRLGSERMELFCDGKSILLDDYVGLFGCGLPPSFNELVSHPNRGQNELVSRFCHALNQSSFKAPITYDRIITIANLVLIIEKLALAGGGMRILINNQESIEQAEVLQTESH